MQSYTIRYKAEEIDTLPLDKINAAKSILIQVFATGESQNELENIVCTLENLFPTAHIIGALTQGAILDEKTQNEGVVLSITAFDKSVCKIKHLKTVTYAQSFQSGEYLAEELLNEKSKVLILFCDAKTTDVQSFTNGIRSIKNDILISGGVVESSVLLSNYGISPEGVVCAVIENPNLHVQSYYKCDWIPFGKKFTVTHADDNRIYTIDHMKATDFFKHYLGEEAFDNFHHSRLLFPLVKKENGLIIARTMLNYFDDGSITFGAKMQTGEVYQFGFGDLEQMLKNHNLPRNEHSMQKNETIFVYSCEARLSMMHKAAQREIAPLYQLGSVSGFFTRGEIFTHKRKTYLLNHTMTMLALSEKSEQISKNDQSHIAPLAHKYSTLSTLAHLMTVTNSELQEYNSYLQERDTLLCQGPVINFKIEDYRGKGFTYVSQNVKRLLGYSSKEFITQEVTLYDIFDHETLQELLRKVEQFKKENTHVLETQCKAYTKFHEEKYLHIVLSMSKNSKKHDSFLGYCIDITTQVQTQKKIQKLAFYDHVTGLPNRELLKRTLQEKIDEAVEKNKLCAVSFFDLDKFKDVNDTYGHSTGDRLLQLVANRVKTVLKPDDFIARIGGDEFILIHGNLNKQTVQSTILSTINRILTLIHEPFSIDGKIAHISTSIGTAIYGIDGESVEDLIKHADMAMYEAKSDPNIHFKFYTHTIRLLREEELSLKNDLKEAVKNREFYLLYQPQVDIHSGKIVGAEALIRWDHPKRGTISPATFIPLAEEMHLIVEIGEWILEEVCHKIQKLQSAEHIPQTFQSISVNISPLQFNDPYFVSKVEKIIKLLQIDTSYLEFELTEGVLVEDIDALIGKMHKLKAMGITISLDDFGTGYSSLQYLKQLPIDTIKIDRAFISDLEENRKDQFLTSTIIQLSKNLRCKIVAEGVENLEQLAFLEKNNCQSYQGFYFSKPIRFETLENLLVEELHEEVEEEV